MTFITNMPFYVATQGTWSDGKISILKNQKMKSRFSKILVFLIASPNMNWGIKQQYWTICIDFVFNVK